MNEPVSVAELRELYKNCDGVRISIDRVSLLLLRAMIAQRHPDAAELSMDWGETGLSCGWLYDATGAQIEAFDEDDEEYVEDPWMLGCEVRGTGDVKDILIGPNNGPFRLQIR